MKAGICAKRSVHLFARTQVQWGSSAFYLSLLLFICSAGYSQTTPLTFTSIPYSDPDFIAPGRGAQQWHNANGAIAYPAENAAQPSMDVYYRFTWNRLEGSEQGSYNWSYFDELVQDAINQGQKLSFGIMSCYPDGSGGPGVVEYDNGNAAYPEYLHRLMQSEAEPDWKSNGNSPTDGYGTWIPNWNSHYYLERLKALHVALYAHIMSASYTAVAGPRKGVTIAFKDAIFSIDIRGYGSWGEWHSAGIVNLVSTYPAGRKPTAATLKTIIDNHVNVFTDHPLSIMISAFDGERLPNTLNPKEVAAYALSVSNKWGKLGWRRDNWGAIDSYIDDYLKDNLVSFASSGPFNNTIMDRWKDAPVSGEPPNWEASLSGCSYDDLERQVREYHATSVGNGNYGSYDLSACAKDNIRNALKATGYRIVLTGGTVSSTIKSGGNFSVSLNWINEGIAPAYETWQVVYQLKDKDGKIAWSGTSKFTPGKSGTIPGLLPSSTATISNDNFTLPANVAAGSYSLNLIVNDPSGFRLPLPLAIQGRNVDGSYTLKNVVVTTGTNEPAPAPAPQRATLTGVVQLQGRPAAPAAPYQVSLEVNLLNSQAKTVAGSFTVSTDSSGRFVIDSLTPGVYDISVKGSHTLTRTNSNDSLTAGNNVRYFEVLLEGDVDNDNAITGRDSLLLSNNLATGIDSAGYNQNADLNEDGVTDSLDVALFLANYHSAAPGNNCELVSATIDHTSNCSGQAYNLVLSDANGEGPFDLIINGKLYENVPVGGVITTVKDERLFNTVPDAGTYDDNPVELGMKFTSHTSGYVKGIRFFSANHVSASYTGHLWSEDGNQLASAEFSNVTANGWQEVYFTEPVLIEANKVYVASYYTSAGVYAATGYGLNESVSNGGSLTILSNATDGGNGVYSYGGGFPAYTYHATNYWVDVIFSTAAGNFALTGVTDSKGCSKQGDLQQLVVTQQACAEQTTVAARGVNASSTSTVTSMATSNATIQATFELVQNYPNPFRGETVIRYGLGKAANVSLSVFDMNGRLIRMLVNGNRGSGTYTVPFHAGSLPAGIYLYRLQAGDFIETKRMVLQ
jgi:hypothetical protein